MIGILEAKNQQKVDNFKPVYLGNYLLYINEIEFVFLNILLTTFIMVIFIYFALDKIFPCFFLYFSSITVSFLATNRTWIILLAVIDIQKYWYPPEIGGATMGGPIRSERGPPKSKLFFL